MANSSIEHIVDKWRGMIKGRKRVIISLEEIMEQKIQSLRPWIFHDTEPLEGWTYRQFIYSGKNPRRWIDDDWRPIELGDTWGGENVSALFRCRAEMPERFRGRKVALRLYFQGDGLLRVNGRPYHGLDPFRDAVFMTDNAQGDEQYHLEAECYIMWHFGEGIAKIFESSHWAVFDEEMNAAYWDLKAAFNVLICEDIQPDLTVYLRDVLHKATNYIEQECANPDLKRAQAVRAQRIVRDKIYDCDRFQRDGLLHLCGHSHLDLVYLWTHAEYERKLGRTHATALRMMERYPEYIFSQSQPQMYSRMKELYPEMYEEVKKRIAEGRWEAIGAFWVEPDCNLISGESMIRQILHGVNFLKEEFGITPRTAWIPDVFGNAWSMPQILVKCGLKYFVTHKMDIWNDTNPWDRHVFWWEGPDGSRVFSTVPPTHFIGTCEPDHLNAHWDKFSHKTEVPESLFCYGWGDGGGGPDPEMLEYCKRYRHFPGVVGGRMSTIEEGLERMHDHAVKAGGDIPVINDELYLEEHRGVYTTKARLKKLNRWAEILYRDAELFSSLAPVKYPAQEFDRGWKELLTTQFHDSLPGTHVSEAYEELLEMYDRIYGIGNSALDKALKSITDRIDTTGPGRPVVVFNSLRFRRDTVARIPCPEGEVHILDDRGNEVVSQVTDDFETGEKILIFEARDLPGIGFRVFHLVEGPGCEHSKPVSVDDKYLENQRIRIAFNDRGEVISLFDKVAGRECIDPENGGNILQMFEDMPGTFDAWDIEKHYEDTEFELPPASVRVLEEGPLQSSLLIQRRFMDSDMKQRVVLSRDGRRVEFRTWINWKERHKLLKMRFHTNIRSRRAVYDIPFATIDRPVTRNNSHEEAKFEVPAHQWMDLSQTDHGLSLLTDCKYGYEARDRMIGLTLLKGPVFPDPQSDQEEHHFIYALYPHPGSWREAGTIDEAADLNIHAYTVIAEAHNGTLPPVHSLISIEGDGVSLEAMKQAEASDDYVIRLVERNGSQTCVKVRCNKPVHKVFECDLLEEDLGEVRTEEGTFEFDIKPYEIRTFRIVKRG